MAFAGNYGYFRDELYYIVSGTQHLSLGYVDFPPVTAWVAALLYPLTGDSQSRSTSCPPRSKACSSSWRG